MVSTVPAPETTEEVAAASQPTQPTPVDPVVLRLPESWATSETAMLELWELNPEWDIEVTDEGALSIMPGTGYNTSEAALLVGAQVMNWVLSVGGGRAGGADGMVKELGGGPAMMAPDVSWVSDERAAQIPDGDNGLLPICPDFVVEVRSVSDRPSRQRAKMERWIGYGARLGWLIDIFEDQVWVYREGEAEPELLERPDSLSGEDVLKGLTVDLGRVWDE